MPGVRTWKETDFDNLHFSREVGNMAVAGSSMGIGPIFSAPANGNQAPPVGKKNNCVHSAAGLQVLQDFGGSSMLMFVLKGETKC